MVKPEHPLMASTQKEQVAAFYEAHHSRGKYDYFYGGDDRKELFVRLVGTGRKVLEVGCRSGNLTQHYVSGNQVTGVDIDRAALKLFEERLACKGHWIDVDEEPLPFPDKAFDVVVFSEVMEHVRFPQKALGEIRRVLKLDGRLVGSVPNAFRLRNRLRFLVGNQYESDHSHLRQYSFSILRRELEPHFREVEIHPVSGHLLGGGSTGIPVFPWLPFRVRALFALDLVFVGKPK
jgi:ubiquinone/menaquinone biosynthesis C-methylase UbiE